MKRDLPSACWFFPEMLCWLELGLSEVGARDLCWVCCMSAGAQGLVSSFIAFPSRLVFGLALVWETGASGRDVASCAWCQTYFLLIDAYIYELYWCGKYQCRSIYSEILVCNCYQQYNFIASVKHRL